MNSKENDDYLKINRYNLAGLESILEENNEDAFHFFEQSLKFDKNDFDSWIYQARLLSNMKRNKESVKCWNNALKIKPESYYALVGKGVSLFRSGKVKEGLKLYEKASKIDPKDPVAWHNIGNAYADSGEYRKAIICLSKAIKLGIKSGSTWNFLGQFYSNVKKFDMSEHIFRKGLKLFPKDVGLLTSYADLLITRGKNAKAIAILNKATFLDPSDGVIWYNKGRAFSKMNKLDNAMACLLISACLTSKQNLIKLVKKEDDLKNILDTPQFKKLKIKISALNV